MLVFGVVSFWVVQVREDEGVVVKSERRRRKRIEGGDGDGAIVVCFVKGEKRKSVYGLYYREKERKGELVKLK